MHPADIIATARHVVTHPEAFAHQPAIRQSAWAALTEARGSAFRPESLPQVRHCTLDADRLGIIAMTEAARPAILRAVAALRRPPLTTCGAPTGGDAA